MSLNFLIDVHNLREMVHGDGPIVVVDDDEEQNFIVKKCYQLSGRKNNLIFLKDGHELLDMVHNLRNKNSQLPELVLLDINMPGLNGLQTLQKVRESAELKDSPQVIILTASESPDDQKKAKAYGANGYWTKPSSVKEYTLFFKKI